MSVDFGPLSVLIGEWKGSKGEDIAPDPDGSETNPYYETIRFEAVGDVDNAEEQNLAVVRYLQRVNRHGDDKLIHDETGYWLWDAASNTVTHAFTIPRGVAVCAGGSAQKNEADAWTFTVAARLGDEKWGIVEAPFMQDKASTKAYKQTVTVAGDTLSYQQTITVDIYGKVFKHTDESVLTRVV